MICFPAPYHTTSGYDCVNLPVYGVVDFMEERKVLHRSALPQLREFCMRQGESSTFWSVV
jgi:hypothetical protein